MSEDLPRDVLEEMREIMDKMNLFDVPPHNSFTINEYHAMYIEECDEKGIEEKYRMTAAGMRKRLEDMVESGQLESGKFNIGGSVTTFFWNPEK
jgi:hypothetical protein